MLATREVSIKFFGAVNLIVAFLFEIMVVAAYACLSRIAPGGALVRYGIAVIVTSVVIAMWALFAAPLSPRRLMTPWLYYFKMLVYGGGAAVLLRAHWVHLAIYFVAIAIFSLGLEVSQSRQSAK